MSRFNAPEDIVAWADAAAPTSVHKHLFWGHCINPYCTPGRRSDFWRGMRGDPPRPWEGIDHRWDISYQRGAACARYLATLNNAAKTTPTP